MSSDSWKATPHASHALVIRTAISAGAPENIPPNWPAIASSDAVLSITTR
jgi:hypothetical protein